jgi:FGFR1 oncogene partner|tara:strand:- start:164 stop:1240 length:1077 start_codon:yes stop_codon:yes gene_type:complete
MSSSTRSTTPSESEDEQSHNTMVHLKNAVAQTLESKGVLGRIRAQLRAAVFTAIDTQEKKNGIYYENQKLNRLQKTEEGRAAIALVHDFLECLDLHSTKSVFLSEITADDEGDLRVDASDFADSRGMPDGTAGTSVLMQLMQSNNGGATQQRHSNSSSSSSSAAAAASSPSSSSSSSTAPTARESKTSPSSQTNPPNRSSASKVRTPTSGSKTNAGPRNNHNSSRTSNDGKRRASPHSRNTKDTPNTSTSRASSKLEDSYGDDEDAFEDVQSDGSADAFEIADDGLVSQSGSFGDESGDFGLSRSRNSNRSLGAIDRSTDSLNMSTSIVQDSMDISIQGSLAMNDYDFVEMAQAPPKT